MHYQQPPPTYQQQHQPAGFGTVFGAVFLALWAWTITAAIVSYVIVVAAVEDIEDDLETNLMRLFELL